MGTVVMQRRTVMGNSDPTGRWVGGRFGVRIDAVFAGIRVTCVICKASQTPMCASTLSGLASTDERRSIRGARRGLRLGLTQRARSLGRSGRRGRSRGGGIA
jgi:hypothetical protein